MKDTTPHILCVIYGTELYGSERGTLQALIALRDAGVNVSVVGSGRKPHGGQTGKAITELGFPLYLLPFGSHFNRKWILTDGQYRSILIRRIKRCNQRFELILRTLRPTHILICGTSPLPFILTTLSRNKSNLLFRMGDAGQSNSKLHNWLWKWLVKKSSTIVAISDFIRTHIEKQAGNRVQDSHIHVIRNIAPARPGMVDKDLISELTSRKQPFQLVYVGQLTEKKGVHILVEALIALDDPDVGCWIIGHSLENDVFEQELKARIEASKTTTNIEFKGYLSDPRAHFAAADWHIAPSVYEEPLGNVVQEAQREGTPSIISNRGGLPELVEHKRTGWILDDATAPSIKQTILHLKEKPAATRSMGAEAKGQYENYGFLEFQSLWMKAVDMP